MDVVVVGMGKIGLPLAVQFASRGHRVVGVDVNGEVVDQVNAGFAPFPGEEDLDRRLAEAVRSSGLRATTDAALAVGACEVVVVVVPLVVGGDGAPDFAIMDSVTKQVGAAMKPGTLVSYETTLPVGTTRHRLLPALEAASGLVGGRDFFLVFSPERVLTGRVFRDLRRYPKLVGGIDAESTRRGIAFYATALAFDERSDLPRSNGVWDLRSCEAAEFAKLAETTFRDVNIGLANQFALYAEKVGVDIYDVIEASNSQPYSHLHRPGVSVGGHCIPVYPQLYLWNDADATIVRAAREANRQMPSHAVALLAGAMGELGARRVVVLGVAYRGGVKETAFSGAFPLVEELRARGADVSVHDPLYADQELADLGMPPYHLGDRVDAAILHTDHAVYRELTAADLPGIGFLVDGRALTDADHWPGVVRLVIGTSAAGG